MEVKTWICNICKKRKPLTEYHIDNSNKRGRSSRCKICSVERSRTYYHKNKDMIKERYQEKDSDSYRAGRLEYYYKNQSKVRERTKKYQESPEVCKKRYTSSRKSKLKKKYGMTMEEYLQLEKNQGGVCAICRREAGEETLSVDHCHITGKVRGLLCRKCNSGLGFFEDDSVRLRNAAKYLKKKKDVL